MNIKYLIFFMLIASLLGCKKRENENPYYPSDQFYYFELVIIDSSKWVVDIDSITYLAHNTKTFIHPLRGDVQLNTVNDTSTYYFYTHRKADTLWVYSKRSIAIDGSEVRVVPVGYSSTF